MKISDFHCKVPTACIEDLVQSVENNKMKRSDFHGQVPTECVEDCVIHRE